MLVKAHPHQNLYEHNFTLINITNFNFIINNDICNVSKESLKNYWITKPKVLKVAKCREKDESCSLTLPLPECGHYDPTFHALVAPLLVWGAPNYVTISFL